MEIIVNQEKFNLEIANTFLKKLFGLMGKTNIKKGLFFFHTRSIHTFLMKEDIDIIMINKDNKVIYFEKKVPRNKVIIKKRAYHTIELPTNSITNLKIGDEIIIIEKKHQSQKF